MNIIDTAIVFLSLLTVHVLCDTPADCHSYDNHLGTWEIHLTEQNLTGIAAKTECTDEQQLVKTTISVVLSTPNIAKDANGYSGRWTAIYNQGLEVTINDSVYFAFFNYTQKGKVIRSYCDQTKWGWYHEVSKAGYLPQQWGCCRFEKKSPSNEEPFEQQVDDEHDYHVWLEDPTFAAEINMAQDSWTAELSGRGYYHGVTVGSLSRRRSSRVSMAQMRDNVRKSTGFHPEAFIDTSGSGIDWRNVSDVDYTKMRDQLSCGSCYAFGSTQMLNSRIRINSKMRDRTVHSVEDVVSCSEYSQQCDGVFPYLVMKYVADYGLVPEQRFGYLSGFMDSHCYWKQNDTELRGVKNYGYVGGYFGACSEQAMIEELDNYGPVAVSFEVYPDFELYTKGIYHHVNVSSTVNPFVATNHVVTVVGYGFDESSQQKYWIVANSWGRHFGMHGFFFIRRGTNECGIESMAVGGTPLNSVSGFPPTPVTNTPPYMWTFVISILSSSLLAVTWGAIGVHIYRSRHGEAISFVDDPTKRLI